MVGYRVLQDGSWLVVRDAKSSPSRPSKATNDVLGPVHDFIVGAIIGGAAGNLSYDVLKACVVDLVSRGDAEDRPPATAAEVSAIVEEFMLDAGYGPIELRELLRIGDDGWLVRVKADGRQFEARIDPSGLVAHIRAAG